MTDSGLELLIHLPLYPQCWNYRHTAAAILVPSGACVLQECVYACVCVRRLDTQGGEQRPKVSLSCHPSGTVHLVLRQCLSQFGTFQSDLVAGERGPKGSTCLSAHIGLGIEAHSITSVFLM